jgi:hypothetical protein
MNNLISFNIANFALEPVIATSIMITSMEYKEHSLIMLKVIFLNADKHPVKDETVTIEGSEYAAWGNSDEYIIQLVMQKYGLVLRTA